MSQIEALESKSNTNVPDSEKLHSREVLIQHAFVRATALIDAYILDRTSDDLLRDPKVEDIHKALGDILTTMIKEGLDGIGRDQFIMMIDQYIQEKVPENLQPSLKMITPGQEADMMKQMLN